ncbi:short-chain dehydrogenase [Aspergillus lentulus]|uniref:Short-chain dehydrogenase n=1 Tax=Aspergillus lentulus TaxID=293939 RepID=A0ABQ1B5C6_ASPLE|nr:short-chain dehydrogenase [Aspergillus lentulus]GFG10582.1 short-chain dehydrogenase [Aspergillus udagawae]
MPAFNFSTTGSEVVAALPDRVIGKTFVITGASHGGLGAQTALCLALANPAEIILLGRSEEKVSPVMKDISKISPSTIVRFIRIDLMSCASVRAAAAEINASVSKIDVLINNAGIMGVKFSLTAENVESHLGANHIGHFLLTNLLVPKLEASGGGARIVNVSSAMYQLSPVIFDNYNFSDGKIYDAWIAYGQSKTANILLAVALASKLGKKGIKSYSLHPGVIQTTGLSGVEPEAWPIVGSMFESKNLELPKEKNMEQGCATTLAAALDPALDNQSGSFLSDCNPEKVLNYARDASNAEKLWTMSEEIVGEKFCY